MAFPINKLRQGIDQLMVEAEKNNDVFVMDIWGFHDEIAVPNKKYDSMDLQEDAISIVNGHPNISLVLSTCLNPSMAYVLDHQNLLVYSFSFDVYYAHYKSKYPYQGKDAIQQYDYLVLFGDKKQYDIKSNFNHTALDLVLNSNFSNDM